MNCNWLKPMFVGVVALAMVGCGGSLSSEESRRSVQIVGQNPLAGVEFYVNPDRPVMYALADLEQQGRTEDAALLRRIADQSTATWAAGGGDDAGNVGRVTTAAAAAGQTALITIYNLPLRDSCGGYSSGGASNAEAYRRWVTDVAAAINGPAVIILEPDAVADSLEGCLEPHQVEERYGLIHDAIGTFRHNSHVRALYLDAANARWFPEPARLADALHRAGVHEHGVNGVSINVSNFVSTEESTAWAQRLVQSLDSFGGQAGVVIDTSRNGNGPYEGDLAESWCNPPGRALGEPPSVKTDGGLIHATLWVKVPGESDGACRSGEPRAGQFWLDYALDLARSAS